MIGGSGMGPGAPRLIKDTHKRSSISFDGTNDFLSIPAFAYSGGSGVSDFSLSIWIRFPSGGSTPFRRKSIADIYTDTSNFWKITYDASSQETFIVTIGGSAIVNYVANSAIDAALADTFIHYVISHDRSSGTTVYRNGAALTAGTNTIADTTTNIHIAQPLRIGIFGTAYAEFLCKEFAFYSGTLSAADVAALYNNSSPHVKGTEGAARNGLRGLYLMGDGTEKQAGTTIYNMAAAGLGPDDATLTNGATFSTTV
tara:strand:- start:3757 stop:4524 length:768 start_codon:yes stop_codon:yes gene_type:complete